MKNIVFLFPGQGSQSIGMGQDLHAEFDFVRELFDMAEEVTRLPIKRLCFQGPMEKLTETVNLQPAVTAVNLACLAAVEKEGVQPAVAAGHSLGEYVALRSARVVTAMNCLQSVLRRGELMHREAQRHPGAMHAVLGLDIGTVQSLVDDGRSAGPVSVANHNTERQIVITGAPGAVEAVSRQAAASGGKSIALRVSGAWHSELIRGAEDEFRQFLADVDFRTPEHRVIFNVSADFETDPGAIRDLMVAQLCSPVRWYDAMKRLTAEGVDAFVEIGPGKVLSGMLRKILPKESTADVYNVSDLKSLEAFFNAVR